MIQTDLVQSMTTAIEIELQRQVARLDMIGTESYLAMLRYHMGWNNEYQQKRTTGKRLRPLLLLLSVAGCGGDWQKALPGAAAIELVHNFSLVHDDIQDSSSLRRGRPTVWKKWGVPQGINAGDGLFALADLAILELEDKYDATTVLRAAKILHTACLLLTRGQFQDMWFENVEDVTLEKYWGMVTDKTASLLSASTEIGSVIGMVEESRQEAYRAFGHYLGLAFQVQDDFLGIWGNMSRIGKSNESDLILRKKTLPILYGLNANGLFASTYLKHPITNQDVAYFSGLLADEGAKTYTENQCATLIGQARDALKRASPTGDAGSSLFSLVEQISTRQQ